MPTEQLSCPHCRLTVLAVFQETYIAKPESSQNARDGHFTGCLAVCPACSASILRIQHVKVNGQHASTFGVWPRHPANRLPPSAEVPSGYRRLFLEAASVLELSPMSSAALSRRCLQQLIRDHYGITKPNLQQEIQEVLDKNLLPGDLATHLDAVRNIGNFAAHPMKSTNAGEIIEVEPHEADWTLEVLEEIFDHAFPLQPFEHEARRLLGDALDKSNPYPLRDVKEAAAVKLLEEFVALAKAQGLQGGRVEGQDSKAFYVALTSHFSVRLYTDGETFRLQGFQHQYVGKPRVATLQFDCVTKTFESTELDTETAPAPGQRLPRVHPLVVLARLTAELLTTKGDD